MTNTLITHATAILRQGGLVAFPTETVYGLGADAQNPSAIARIFAAKERPTDHPLIVHLASWDQVTDWARDIPGEALQLAQAFWPGSLTLILKKQAHVLDAITGGQDTVGLRIPNHPIALELLREFGNGIAAPSANKFTRISPTTARAVQEELGNQVDLILDGGECDIGLESTIVDLSSEKPSILRPGMIGEKELANVLGKPIQMITSTHVRTAGMHELHYAPRTKTRLISRDELTQLIVTDFPVIVIHHSDFGLTQNKSIQFIRMPYDAHAYAHQLYQTLREADHLNAKEIVIERVPEGSEWEAIRDRLRKASH